MGGQQNKIARANSNNLAWVSNALKDKVVRDPDLYQKPQVQLKSLWEHHKGPTILEFFRRWG